MPICCVAATMRVSSGRAVVAVVVAAMVDGVLRMVLIDFWFGVLP
jgi:hypothetical protein